MNDNRSRQERNDRTANIQSACSVGGCRRRKGPLTTTAGSHSDIGKVRSSNDDLVFAGDQCRLYVVLDGVGGHAGGAQASLIVMEELRANIEAMCERNFNEATEDLEAGVRNALKSATNAMLSLSGRYPEFSKMSTVFALAYIIDGMLLYTHVGDCRVYVVRNNQARQLTHDETFVQLMVDTKAISSRDAETHPMRNVVLNAVGTRAVQYDPVVNSIMLLPGDTVLLTSDGVTDALSNAELADICHRSQDPQGNAEAIVNAALDAGSKDNVSCIVATVDRASCPVEDAATDLHFELAKLHEMLSQVDSADCELRNEMSQVAEDLRIAIKKSKSVEARSLTDSLQDQVLLLKAKHPHLVSAVSGIADLLSGMGI